MRSGARRLAVFLTVLWNTLWCLAYVISNEPINWSGVLMFGVFPSSLVWGLWWVWRGFRPAR